MPTIRTQLELIDNMSNRLEKIEAAARNTTSAAQQLQSAYSTSTAESQMDSLGRKLELQEKALELQGRSVESLQATYENFANTQGTNSQKAIELSQKLTAAQLAELSICEAANKTAMQIDKQKSAAIATAQALEQAKAAEDGTFAKASAMAESYTQAINDVSSELANMSQYANGMDLEIFKATEMDKYNSQLGKVSTDLQSVRTSQAALNTAMNSGDVRAVEQAMKSYDMSMKKVIASEQGAITATEKLKSVEWQRVEALSQTKKAQEEAYATSAYEKTKSGIIQTQQAQKQATQEIHNSRNAQNQFTQAIHSSGDAVGKLLNRIQSMFSIYMAVRGMKKLFGSTVSSAMDLQQQLAMMSGQFGNSAVAEEYFKMIQKRAAATGTDIEQLTQATRNFMTYTKNTAKLDGFLDISEKLAMKNPTQGIDGAAYAIQEALSGQFTSLRNRFNIPASQLTPLKKAIKTGNIEGIQTALNEAISMSGVTDEVVNAYKDSARNQFNSITTMFSQGMAQAGNFGLDRLIPVLEQVKTWLQSDGASNFFAGIATGVEVLVNAMVGAGQIAMNVAGWIIDNWSFIQPILIGIGGAFLIMKANAIIAATASIASAAASGAAWAVAHWPVFAIIGALVIAISVIRRYGVTWEQICGAIGGVIGVMYSIIHNCFAGIYNIVASVAEFLMNVFIDPVYAIEKLFYDVTVTVLGFFEQMINGILSGVNWVIEKMNSLLGTDIKTVQVDFVNNLIDKVPTPTRDGTVQIERMKYKDAYEYAAKGKEIGEAVPGKLKNILNGIKDTFNSAKNSMNAGVNQGVLDNYNLTALDTLPSIDDNTKKIKDNVSMSSEDLKYLRDIAEKDVINKFTTAKISVNMGGITNKVDSKEDLDGVAEYLKKKIEEEMYIVAEGAH